VKGAVMSVRVRLKGATPSLSSPRPLSRPG
jgi:hypothetical protein